MLKRFWLPSGHATELAEQRLTTLGWTPTSGADWDLAWTLDHPEAATFAAAEQGRWVNHIRGISALAVKNHLCVTLRNAETNAAAAGARALYRFAPQTFLLPAEWDSWLRARAWDPDAIWIQKPADLSRGRGVALVTDVNEVANGNLVIQRYIANPHLLDGFKYSLRFYVLIVSIDPLIAYVFDGGFTKFASRPFSLDPAELSDRFRHLTNPDILRDDPLATGVSTRNTTHRAYRERLQSIGIDDARLWQEMRRMLAATIGAAQPVIRATEQSHNSSGRGQFELLGIDVTIDDQLRPWLLECNLSPSLSVEASAESDASREEADIKTKVIADTLRLIGADALDSPRPVPANAIEARAALAWYDEQRGNFERLWPSTAALESLAGAEFLSDMDRALLDDEAGRAWPAVVVNGVETIAAGNDTVIYDPRRQRATLLEDHEARSWTDRRGIEWLRLGWLAPESVRDTSAPIPIAPPLPRRRNQWNRERVYRIHGLRIAISCATPKLDSTIERAMAWWDADDEQEVDATIHLPRWSSVADVFTQINTLVLQHRDAIVRRSCAIEKNGDRTTLILSGSPSPSAMSQPILFGGSPFGAWIDVDGTAQLLENVTIIATQATAGDALLDLLSEGPGVVRALHTTSIRALATWLESVRIATLSR